MHKNEGCLEYQEAVVAETQVLHPMELKVATSASGLLSGLSLSLALRSLLLMNSGIMQGRM
jgi:hypothetical protein